MQLRPDEARSTRELERRALGLPCQAEARSPDCWLCEHSAPRASQSRRAFGFPLSGPEKFPKTLSDSLFVFFSS